MPYFGTEHLFDWPQLFIPHDKKLNMQMSSFSRTQMKWFLESGILILMGP